MDILFSAPKSLQRTALNLSAACRFLLLLTLVFAITGCALFRRDRDEVDVEKLRLKYQKGKMGALLDIIEIYEDTEAPLSVRLAAAEALGESRHPKAIDALGATVSEAEALNIDMMIASIDILSRIPSDATARALTRALSTTDAKLAELRTKLIEGLEAIGSEDYIHTLIDLYQASRESHLRMQQMLTSALGSIGDEKAIPVLMNIAADPEIQLATRSAAIEILAQKQTPEIIRMFADMLGDPTTNMQLREFALRAMGDIKEERLVLSLLETYQLGRQEYFSLLNSLLTALGEFDDPVIKPTMLEIATSDDFPLNFRKQAIINLANFNDPTVLDRVIPLLEDPENYHLLGEITTLTEALLPGADGRERLRRAALKAAKYWEGEQ
ncbi:MAG: HEAT repeat domain-containing protein [Fidelibacterota bacterium]|nr:MAG: HEAT repeat domain-containing protein [Candidatus Neomarinimicrobiota bacterium]